MADAAQLVDWTGKPIASDQMKRAPEGRAFIPDPTFLRHDINPSRGLTGPQLDECYTRAVDQGDVYSQARLFADIEEKDWDVFTALQTRKLAPTGVGFEILENPKSKRAKQVADHVKEALAEIDIDSMIVDALDSLGKGYSCLQLLWKPGGALASYEHVEAHNFTFRIPGTGVGGATVPRLLTKEAPVDGVELEPFRWIYHRHKARSGDVARAGLLRTIGWMYLFKMNGVRNLVRFIERHGMPFVVAKVDEQAWQTDRGAIKAVIRSMGPDGGGVFSKAVELELLEAADRGADVYFMLLNYFGAGATKVILGQTLTTDTPAEGGGTRAQGQVHQLVRQDLLESDCKGLSITKGRDLIRPIVGFKFGFDEPLPTIKFKYEPPADLKTEADTTLLLEQSGWQRDEEEMNKKFGMKLTRKTPSDQPSPFSQGLPTQTAAHSATLRVSKPSQEALDAIVASSLPVLASREVLDPMIGPVQIAIDRAISHSTTVGEFRAALKAMLAEIPGLLPQMNVDEFAKTIGRAMNAAAIDGALDTRRAK